MSTAEPGIDKKKSVLFRWSSTLAIQYKFNYSAGMTLISIVPVAFSVTVALTM